MPTLQCWAKGGQLGCEYHILSFSELSDNPNLLQFVQSDASGVDGFGFFFGAVNDDDPNFIARSFSTDYIFRSSHNAELTFFASFIDHAVTTDCLLIWITDCLSAVWSINKDRCFEPEDLLLLDYILAIVDNKKILLIALWFPRELNELADPIYFLFLTDRRLPVNSVNWSLQLSQLEHHGSNMQRAAQVSSTVRQYISWCTATVLPSFLPPILPFSCQLPH